MSFESIRSDRGFPRVKGICDTCAREEVVPAVHGKASGNEGHGQAATKLQAMGWSYIGKRLRCPACEAKRKASNVTKSKDRIEQPTNAPREPSRQERRQIMEMLGEVYDLEGECYTGGETDATVSEVLGVMPGWVAAIREEFFGPDGANQDMAELQGAIDKIEAAIGAAESRFKADVADLRAQLRELSAPLASIRQAVGPHARAKAGIK